MRSPGHEGFEFLADEARNLELGSLLRGTFYLTSHLSVCVCVCVRPQGRLPVKWMAPEALFDRVYTHQSDV